MVLAYREGVMANLDAAKDIQDRARRLLTRLSHAPHTRTPSPPGSAPASITGTLALSVQAEHDGDDAIVGPTAMASSANGPYGRFLELGGDHISNKPHGMRWFEDGSWYESRELHKEERPYLKPATDDAIHSGGLHQIYYDHWLLAQQQAT